MLSADIVRNERASVCVSGVRLQAVTDQATSLETMLHIEGRSSSPVRPAAWMLMDTVCDKASYH